MSKLTLFNDLVGRTIIGKIVSSDDSSLQVENPAIIHIQPVPSKVPGQGQVQVQVVPYVLPEFITKETRTGSITWSFSKVGVILPSNLEVSEQLVTQYERLFNPSPIITPEGAGKVVNLFDK